MKRRNYDESEHARMAPVNQLAGLGLWEGVAADEPTGNARLDGTLVSPSRPSIYTRWASLTEQEREAQRDRWRELLRPIVIRLADLAAGDGITASDVISHGVTEGVLNGESVFLSANPKVYSFVGPWLAALARGDNAILVPFMVGVDLGPGTISARVHVRRNSSRKSSHGNSQLVYLARPVSAAERAA